MEFWISGVVLLLLLLSLHRVYAQSFQLQMQLTEYQGGNNIPNQLIFEACLRDLSAGCGSSCSPEEAQSATIVEGDLSGTEPLIFPSTSAGDHIVCFRFRRLNEDDIVSSSTEKRITMTETDARIYVRSGSSSNRITLNYELQVLCSENYFSSTCSTLCTLTDTSSGEFMCSGENGEQICQSDQDGGPDLANCQEVVAITTSTTTEEDRGELTTSSPSTNGNEQTTSSTTGNSNGIEETSSTSSSIDGNELLYCKGAGTLFGEGLNFYFGFIIAALLNKVYLFYAVDAVGGLSQGEVAGIIIPILLITALVAAGAVAGILVWKYQPWHNILNKEGTNDALENPVYNEMVLGVGRPGQNNELSASTFSSPLYSDTSADAGEDTAGRREYVENGNLMDIIRMQSAKKKNFKVQHSKEGNNGVVAPQKANMTEDSYRQSFTFGDNRPDNQETYEPVEVSPTPTFDNPDYEAV